MNSKNRKEYCKFNSILKVFLFYSKLSFFLAFILYNFQINVTYSEDEFYNSVLRLGIQSPYKYQSILSRSSSDKSKETKKDYNIQDGCCHDSAEMIFKKFDLIDETVKSVDLSDKNEIKKYFQELDEDTAYLIDIVFFINNTGYRVHTLTLETNQKRYVRFFQTFVCKYNIFYWLSKNCDSPNDILNDYQKINSDILCSNNEKIKNADIIKSNATILKEVNLILNYAPQLKMKLGMGKFLNSNEFDMNFLNSFLNLIDEFSVIKGKRNIEKINSISLSIFGGEIISNKNLNFVNYDNFLIMIISAKKKRK